MRPQIQRNALDNYTAPFPTQYTATWATYVEKDNSTFAISEQKYKELVEALKASANDAGATTTTPAQPTSAPSTPNPNSRRSTPSSIPSTPTHSLARSFASSIPGSPGAQSAHGTYRTHTRSRQSSVSFASPPPSTSGLSLIMPSVPEESAAGSDEVDRFTLISDGGSTRAQGNLAECICEGKATGIHSFNCSRLATGSWMTAPPSE